ncbi:MAG: peptidyl-prolyl cis-trans isomerase, partial [Gemmatimonadetes bacterium]|nr:peptidyl-prolyl cis-trans isomerase [Gemmatimonadota bacterium]
GSAARGGDLGTWTKGQMVAAFDSVAAKIPIGQLSTPFLSPFGYHILQITKREGDKFTGRHILVNIELAGAHRDSVDAIADSLERLAADRVDPAALDTAARALGLRIAHTLPVQRNTQVQAGNTVVANVGTWVFQRAEAGAISPVEETPEALYLFRIDSMTPAGIPPLASIRTAVEHEARQAKKWAKARDLGAALQKRLDEGATLDMATHALSLPHQVLGPFTRINPPFPNPTVIGTAFALQPGQRSKLLDTPDGYYLLESVSHTPADSAEFVRQYADLRTKAIRDARQDRVRMYLQALRDKAKIVDRREELQRQSEAAQAAQDAQASR